jgi:predicted transcriptional regulator of viral defense system
MLEATIQEYGPIFTIDQAAALVGPDMPRSRLRWYLSALRDSGLIDRLKRGTYAVTSPASRMDIHPFAIAAALIQPSAISHWSAVAHHGFTAQVPRMVQVSAPGKVVTPEMRRGKAYRPRGRAVWRALGVEVEIVHVTARHFFGHEQIWVSSWHRVAITNPERTALDLVARSEVFGGLGATMEILQEALAHIDVANLVEYALEYRVGAVSKRLGWCLEQLGVEDHLLAPLEEVAVRNVSKLDPRAPTSSVTNRRWRVNENLGTR